MAHSNIKMWTHSIFGTKNRQKLIKPINENTIHNLIKKQFIEEDCYVDIINGTENHIHVLFLLHPDLSIRKIMKQVKGGSSYEINQLDIIPTKFNWQIGFGAYSVSESHLEKIRQYIINQKEHHKTMTFQEEYEKFMKLYGLENG
ncbi:MAG: IS200/IS605 family transposase [Bacteroidales bacterium]|nr:IS200/IS605 family transposase [Bacteroidales bacterium]